MDSLSYCNFTPTNYMGEPEQGKSGLDDYINEDLARFVRALIIISADSISNLKAFDISLEFIVNSSHDETRFSLHFVGLC